MRIRTTSEQLNEGLFGGVVLWVLEVLPWLRENNIVSPVWDIRSRRYGLEPDYRVLPGAFDPVSAPDLSIDHPEENLLDLRDTALSCFGGDFEFAHELWSSYFKVPERILERANDLGLPSKVVGVHFRGIDKQYAYWDTNPVAALDMVRLLLDFLRNRPAPDALFVATDVPPFVDLVRASVKLPVISLGAGEHHKWTYGSQGKVDHAVLDCLLLSRCRSVIHSASALSAFAKVLNPSLDSYRIAASKLFASAPYFPVAFIPPLTSTDAECQQILARHMHDDWTHHANAVAKFGQPFGARPCRAYNLHTP